MKMMKKTAISVLLALLFLFLFSCGTYKPALNSSDPNKNSSFIQPDLDDDPTNDFTVTLRLNGELYVPEVLINVYWRDGYNIHIASVDDKGVATIDGLDGDYRVTLSAVPNGCAYDPNAYTATNDNRNIFVDLYTLNMVNGSGTELYSCYRMSGTGVYATTIAKPGDRAYFEFAPQTSGTYTVESWVDVNDDGVNPIAIAYYGTSGFKHSPYTVKETGVCGSYTRNFVHTIEIASQMISSGGGGSQTFTFAVTAETKSGVYPVTVAFAIKRNGDFDLNGSERTMILPKADLSHFDFDAFNALAGGTIVGAETLYPGTTNSYMFDEDNYKLWEISKGGDGVYHVYDKQKYPETNGYGPVLVAYISAPCRFLDSPLTNIEDVGNSALTVNGTDNHKLFIEGWKSLADKGYYCVSNCPCHEDGSIRACLPGCERCNKACQPCPAEQMGQEGYAAWCNDDGVAPVTEELAKFLQDFSITQRYFADGDGWVENNGFLNIDAYEDSQWLFACGYYA